jgi:hypothetical protein
MAIILDGSTGVTTPSVNSTSNLISTVHSSPTSLSFQTNGNTTAVTIDTSQNVLVGTTTTTNNLRNGEKVAVVTTGGNQGGASLTTYSGTGAGNGVILDIQRSRGTTDGSMTAVASGDTLGYILFRGSDGTSFQDSSYITGQVDGAVSGGTVPGRLAFITSSAERMRIDSSGNVGIGTSSPSYKLDVSSSNSIVARFARLSFATGYVVNAATETYFSADSGANNGFGADATNNRLVFWANSAERMRIDSSGNLLVSTTDAANSSGNGVKIAGNGSGPYVAVVNPSSSGSNLGMSLYSSGASAFRFYADCGGTLHATSTSIAAISDASLKTNVKDLETGLTQVMALKPRRFDWINGDATNVAGFIAQEVEQVLPELVTDSLYAYDENKNEVYKKNLKMGDMLPTLVKAIQELKQINDTQAETINALTARIEALEKK